jgi:hypothetical protein
MHPSISKSPALREPIDDEQDLLLIHCRPSPTFMLFRRPSRSISTALRWHWRWLDHDAPFRNFLARIIASRARIGKDGKPLEIDVRATSLFDVAYKGIHCWAKLWQWPGDDAITEVHSGEELWRVRISRVSEWVLQRRRPGWTAGARADR